MATYDIYGLGAALVDTEIEVTDTDLSNFGIDKGVMTLVDEPRQHELLTLLEDHLCYSNRASGGSAANSIIAAQYFGASTFYSCKVADDENGAFYLADLQRAGVQFPANAGADSGITGKCLVMVSPDAERTMNTYLGISDSLSIAQINEEALKASKFVYIEGYLVTSDTGRPAAIRLRELAQQHSVKTALSLSDPAIVKFFKEGLTEMIGNGVDILFCNEAEALSYSGKNQLNDALDTLRQCASTVVITRGAHGVVLLDDDGISEIAASQVSAVDTNGAGDMFAGAFLFGLSQQWSNRRSAELAVKAAGQVVSQFGPRLRPEQHQLLLQEIQSSGP